MRALEPQLAGRGTRQTNGLAIDLAHVSKTYRGKVQALRGIEMRVHRGEVFGLLGPNGAGKTTLVKILMRVTRATRCEGTLLDKPVGDAATLARVGYLPEHHRFPDYLTARQVLDYFGAMALVPRDIRRKRGEELLGLVGLTQWADKRVRTFSKGMRQRLGVAQSLINDPELVLLDEPTDGVDPVGRREIRTIASGLRDQGKTVFINSHLLSELEMVCDRVAILVRGVVAQQGTIDELTQDQQRYEIEVAAATPEQGEALIRAAISSLTSAKWGQEEPPAGWQDAGRLRSGQACRVVGATAQVRTNDAADVQPLIDALRRSGVVVRAVRSFRPTLEDLFMKAVTDPRTGEVLPPGAESPKG